MKKQLVKILSLLIAVLTLVASLPMAAFAETVVAASDPSGDQLSDPGYIEVNDGYIQIQVSKQNGGFYIGLVEGDKLTKADDNKNLLFPDSDYDTSFTSFRVKQDGKTTDYIFGGDYSHLGLDAPDFISFAVNPSPVVCGSPATFVVSHNRPQSEMEVTVDIFNLQGQLLWSKSENVVCDGSVYAMVWNGTLQGGQPLSTGVYLARAYIASGGSLSSSRTVKFVVINNK